MIAKKESRLRPRRGFDKQIGLIEFDAVHQCGEQVVRKILGELDCRLHPTSMPEPSLTEPTTASITPACCSSLRRTSRLLRVMLIRSPPDVCASERINRAMSLTAGSNVVHAE